MVLEIQKIRVAIVDDHQLMRETISSTLINLGFEITACAQSGHELLLLLPRINILPDVCLLDVNMPGMKGPELAQILSTLYPDIKSIALTSETDFETKTSMLQAGCFNYLLKKSPPREWKRAIEQAIMMA